MRLDVQQVVLDDTGTGGVIGMLGSGAASVYPRLDDPSLLPPGTSRPFIVLQILPWTRLDTGIATGGFRWRIGDAKGSQYYSIDDIAARLRELFPWRRGLVYADDGGDVFAQQFAFESEDTVDDNWDVVTRWLEWQALRAMG